jgi:putative nucleotidyltransferase with HDIG domain
MDEFLARLRNPFYERITSAMPSDLPIYLVGGAVRDALLGRTSFDLDFVTPGNALKIARKLADELGGAYFALDPQRNVARIILKPNEIGQKELTQTAKIDISKYQGQDLQADLRGRDFTINAMAVEVQRLESVVDPLNGAEDLIKKRLRACSAGSFTADPVRILRAVRFSADLKLRILPETLDLIREAAPLLPRVSAERLRDELFRILVLAHPSSSLRLLDMLGALEPVLPEVCLLKDVRQGSPHVMDAWEHTLDILNRMEGLLEVLSAQYNPDKAGNLSLGLTVLQLGRYRQQLAAHLDSALNPDRPHRGLIFLAGLYHDVGKRVTQSIDEEGAIRFINHGQVGSQLAEKRGQALKLSNLEVRRLVTIVNHHMRPSLLSHHKEAPSRKAVYRFFRDTGVAGVDICLLSLADVLATYGPTLPQERWSRHLEVVRTLLGAWWEDKAEIVLPVALINGDELQKELALAPGPLIGYLLESIREAQVSGEVQDREQALSRARELYQDYCIQASIKKTAG